MDKRHHSFKAHDFKGLFVFLIADIVSLFNFFCVSFCSSLDFWAVTTLRVAPAFCLDLHSENLQALKAFSSFMNTVACPCDLCDHLLSPQVSWFPKSNRRRKILDHNVLTNYLLYLLFAAYSLLLLQSLCNPERLRQTNKTKPNQIYWKCLHW